MIMGKEANATRKIRGIRPTNQFITNSFPSFEDAAEPPVPETRCYGCSASCDSSSRVAYPPPRIAPDPERSAVGTPRHHDDSGSDPLGRRSSLRLQVHHCILGKWPPYSSRGATYPRSRGRQLRHPCLRMTGFSLGDPSAINRRTVRWPFSMRHPAPYALRLPDSGKLLRGTSMETARHQATRWPTRSRV